MLHLTLFPSCNFTLILIAFHDMPTADLAYVFAPSYIAFVGVDVAWIALVAGRMYKEVSKCQRASCPSKSSSFLSGQS